MKIAVTGFVTMTAFAAAFSLPAFAHEIDKDEPVDRGEAKLAQILEGRVAGEPVRCLRRSQSDSMTIIDGTALVFRDGKTIYVNRTTAPRFLDDFDYPVITSHGSGLCRMDRIEMRSRGGDFAGPAMSLDDFIPYTKVETED